MDISKIPVGVNPPWDVNVIIEIPMGGHPCKYEMDKDSGAMVVDRFIPTSMFYPANYGFIPHTMARDGDPLDALVIEPTPVLSASVVRCRPVGALVMEDESGPDEKILMIPVDELGPSYKKIKTYKDLPDIICKQIEHFFVHYKDLEPNKWAKIHEWVGPDEALKLIEGSIEK